MKTLSLFQNICISLILLLGLSSFSTIPTAEVRDDNPPAERTKESHRKKRLNKRYNHLHQRFDKATKTKQRYRLQKKIRAVERQKEGGSPVIGILGLVLGILSFVALIAGIMALIMAGISGASSFGAAGPILITGLVLSIAGLALSIVYSILHNKDPERYPLKGFAIAGIIVSSIMLGFLIIFNVVLLMSNSIQ